MSMRQVYGNGEVKELLSLKYATVLVQRKNRIKQKNPQKSPGITGVTDIADERGKEMEKSIFQAVISMRNILNHPEIFGKNCVAFVVAIFTQNKICVFVN